jgi:hypothetical protein
MPQGELSNGTVITPFVTVIQTTCVLGATDSVITVGTRYEWEASNSTNGRDLLKTCNELLITY